MPAFAPSVSKPKDAYISATFPFKIYENLITRLCMFITPVTASEITVYV
jgi:hypothetical protein